MKNRKKTANVVVSLLALAGLAVFSLTADGGSLEPSAPPGPTMKTLDEVEPRIPIPASAMPTSPFSVSKSGSYYLTGNRHANVTAIIVEANDVTIDLNGFSLIGPAGGVGNGILMDGRTNVEIHNGTARDFGSNGIIEASTTNGREHRVINVRVLANGMSGIALNGLGHLVQNCTAARNNGDGISVGAGSAVTGSTARNNQLNGIYAGKGSTVTRNAAYDNLANGIYTDASCTVTANSAYGNHNIGIYADSGGTVTDNTARNNQSHGIYAGHGCTVSRCTVSYSTGDGILALSRCHIVGNNCSYNGYNSDGAGIHVTGSACRIEGNNVADNDRGIDVDGEDSVIVKNIAYGNTINYDLAAGNFYGSKMGGFGVIPPGYPWANFDL